MRIRYIIGIVIAIVLTTHFAAGSLIDLLDKPEMQGAVIQQEAPASAIHGTLDSAGNIEQEKSIFSMPTLTVLFAAVLGIVAFRRNRKS
jgi:hypothetical protein